MLAAGCSVHKMSLLNPNGTTDIYLLSFFPSAEYSVFHKREGLRLFPDDDAFYVLARIDYHYLSFKLKREKKNDEINQLKLIYNYEIINKSG